jgi:hypothetical protein
MQACGNGNTCTEAYTLAVSANSYQGYEENIDFGNFFAAGGNTMTLLGGFDFRATPTVTTGLNASPPTPEIRNAESDTAWNERFYEATYNNGVLPGTITTVGSMANTSAVTNVALVPVHFSVQKRANPSVTFYSPNSGTSATCYNVSSTSDTSTVVFDSSAGQSGFTLNASGATSDTQSVICHWTADATISGG